MTARDHDTFDALAAPYALGVLVGDERDTFVSHLATCDTCQRQVAVLSRVVEGIPQTLDQVPLPARLKARVLAEATRVDADRVTRPERRHAAPSRWVSWLSAAASFLAVVMGLLAWNGWSEATRLRQQLAVVQRREAALDAQLAALSASAAHAQRTDAVLRASDLGRVDLVGQAGAPGASGRVLWSASQGLVFVAENLPPLTPGRVYQLWIVAGEPLSAGVVAPDAGGRLSAISSQPVAARPKAFAVTLEPEGGRPSPTGPMLLVGAIE